MAKERYQPPQYSLRELEHLAICASAGDTEAMSELYEAGAWPIASKLAEQGLQKQWQKLYEEPFPTGTSTQK